MEKVPRSAFWAVTREITRIPPNPPQILSQMIANSSQVLPPRKKKEKELTGSKRGREPESDSDKREGQRETKRQAGCNIARTGPHGTESRK